MTARVGIAGEVRGKSELAARFGISGGFKDSRAIEMAQQTAAFGISGNGSVPTRAAREATTAMGIAGVNTRNIEASTRGAMGISGLDRAAKADIANAALLKGRDAQLSELSQASDRLGDRAAREAWGRGVWFADFTYLVSPYAPTDKGGYSPGAQLVWRSGRESIFSRENRYLPLLLDSCGYRREITGTAPQWAMNPAWYPQAIELMDPDAYASWDYPQERSRSMAHLRDLMATFPADVESGRMWPVFSIRWAWDETARLRFGKLPGWAGTQLANLIPITRTQAPISAQTREAWARQAIANALLVAQDPDFRWMTERFGRVMLGGMVGGPCPRAARHLFAATLAKAFPEVQFWLLGQANFAVINGLGMLGLLDQVWTDGTWYLKDATAERFAVVEDGLIVMNHIGIGRGKRGERRRESLFTIVEMMAANLRSILAAYQGLWTWPPPEPLPLDLMDVEQVGEMKLRFQAAQLELGLHEEV